MLSLAINAGYEGGDPAKKKIHNPQAMLVFCNYHSVYYPLKSSK